MWTPQLQVLLSVRIRTKSIREQIQPALGMYSPSERVPSCPVPNLGSLLAIRSTSESASFRQSSRSRMSFLRSTCRTIRYSRHPTNIKKLQFPTASAIIQKFAQSPACAARSIICCWSASISFMAVLRASSVPFPCPCLNYLGFHARKRKPTMDLPFSLLVFSLRVGSS